MSDAMPKSHEDRDEISTLLAELDLEIENVNAGLNRLRGVAARVSYAYTALKASQAAPAAPSWAEEAAAEADKADGLVFPASREPATEPVDLASAFAHETAATDTRPEPGFWDSVAEGASWPRAHVNDVPEASPETPVSSNGANGHDAVHSGPPSADVGWSSSVLAGGWSLEAPVDGNRDVAETPDEPEVEQEAAVSDDADAGDADVPAAPSVLEASASRDEWALDRPAPESLEEPEPSSPANEVPAAEAPSADDPWAIDLTGMADAWNLETPASAPAESPVAEEPEQAPAPRISGWPDESVWSTNFAWPSAKREESAAAEVPHGEPDAAVPAWEGQPEVARAADPDIRDIVAQVRAELEAAGQADVEIEHIALTGEEAGSFAATHEQDYVQPDQLRTGEETSFAGPSEDPGTPEIEAGGDFGNGVQDDEAKREEVSRAVEEIRRQIESGGLEAVLREQGIETDIPGSDAAFSGAAPALGGIDGSEGDAAHRPAFRLAAPGSIPDWSHVSVEPSGSHVVVIKDQDGRVELASVFETLNELGCGDGAALLNYTPHSVTVGLPLVAQFPTTEQMEDAVEKVFGLTSRVESDGVRITVNIGADPEQRSVGAA